MLIIVQLSFSQTYPTINTNKSIAINWDNDLYIFNQNYSNLYTSKHNINLAALEDGSYNLHIFDIEPKILYDIKIDGAVVSRKMSNSYGVIENVSIKNSNGHFMEITPHKKLDNKSDIKVNIFPNTLKQGNDLVISLKTIESVQKEVFIYDINGVLVLNKQFRKKEIILTNLNLKKGVYIIKITNSIEVFEKRLIIN